MGFAPRLPTRSRGIVVSQLDQLCLGVGHLHDVAVATAGARAMERSGGCHVAAQGRVVR